MSESVRESAKKPEATKKDKVSQTQTSDYSQHTNSSVDRILFLQRTIGNQAVGRLIKSGALQAKLGIGQPEDEYEQQADKVANAVIRMPEPEIVSNNKLHIRRSCPVCEENKLKRQPIKEEEEEKLQAKTNSDNIPEIDPNIEYHIQSLNGGGMTLPEDSRAFFEPRFGYDFSQVRVHTDSQAAETARVINARAFTIGRNIGFGDGQFAPESHEGRRLMAHELTHVVQQKSYSSKVQRKDTCSKSNSDEAIWAREHEGKIFKSGDNDKEPNEAMLWNFCVGETKLREEHQRSLKQEIPRWKGLLTGTSKSPATRTDLRIKLRGTASSSGNKDANNEIAMFRALAVKQFLEEEGIPGSFIIIEGVGSQFPLADETSPENMARNRRVELFFFTPTVTADITGALVAANVTQISIGKPSATVPPPSFRQKNNRFNRRNPAMIASADVDLTGFGGDSIGFYQLLIGDQRIGYYKTEKDENDLSLDYGRCNTILPCRDVEDATGLFSIDKRSLFLNNTGSVRGTVWISDMPGTTFPIKYPDPIKGPFVLSHYFWKMDFDVILGIRSSGLFMPLQSAVWSLTASEDVDVKSQKTSGLSPISVHQPFAPVSAADKRGELDKAFTGQTCRLMARTREISPKELPCKPVEI